MYEKPDPAIARRFRDLLDARPADENAIQEFLETHTAFFETPSLRHHGLNLNCVISKLHVGPWKTDLAYLSKSSNGWNLVLVELERPDKKLFRASSDYLAPSAELTTALAQVDTWRDEWERNRDGVLDRLRPLLVPPKLGRNPVTAHYVLIIGRDDEIQGDPDKRRRLDAYVDEKNLTILTFDTLLRTYEEGRGYAKCVLSPTARGYRIKHLEAEPYHLFAHVENHDFEVSAEAEAKLVGLNYDIPAWRQGKLLKFGVGRWASEPDQTADQIMEALKQRLEAARRQS